MKKRIGFVALGALAPLVLYTLAFVPDYTDRLLRTIIGGCLTLSALLLTLGILSVGASLYDRALPLIKMLRAKPQAALVGNERISTSYHEAAHAVFQWFMPLLPPVDVATIVPGPGYMGRVTSMKREMAHLNAAEHYAHIGLYMAGRVGEVMFGFSPSSSASGDIHYATHMSTMMVTKYGLGSLGPIAIDLENCSGDVLRTVEEETIQIHTDAYAETERFLRGFEKQIESVAVALYLRGTVKNAELEVLLGPRPTK